MKKTLDHRIEISSIVYSTLEEAMQATGLTKRQLMQRATDESNSCKWVNPSTRRSYLGKRSRRKGNAWELEIIKHLKEIGYEGCVSSRSESKRLDDAKVDIADTKGELPCYIQAKNTKVIPNYHKIEEECTKKDKPFVIAHKGLGKEPIAIMSLDFFYKLISKTN